MSNNKRASMLHVNQECYRDIKNMNKLFKRKKSDIDQIKKSWINSIHKSKIKKINIEINLVDVYFLFAMNQCQSDIYRMFQIPKEYVND